MVDVALSNQKERIAKLAERIEVCQKHGGFRREGGAWLYVVGETDVTDVSDNADFTEGTCPNCSSDEEPH